MLIVPESQYQLYTTRNWDKTQKNMQATGLVTGLYASQGTMTTPLFPLASSFVSEVVVVNFRKGDTASKRLTLTKCVIRYM